LFNDFGRYFYWPPAEALASSGNLLLAATNYAKPTMSIGPNEGLSSWLQSDRALEFTEKTGSTDDQLTGPAAALHHPATINFN